MITFIAILYYNITRYNLSNILYFKLVFGVKY